MSQRQFARLLGITPGAICNWEQGLNGPSESRLADIAKKLQVSFDALLEDSQEGLCILGLKNPSSTLTKSDRQAIEDLADRIIRIHEVNPRLAEKVMVLIEEVENSLNPANPAFRAIEARARQKSSNSKHRPIIVTGAGLSVSKKP